MENKQTEPYTIPPNQNIALEHWWVAGGRSEVAYMLAKPTYVSHLWHCGAVGCLLEDGRVVVDVLHADDERGRGLERPVGLAVGRRGDQAVLVLLLAVQGLGDVDVACLLVDDKH